MTRQSLVGLPAQGEFFELYRMPCLRYVKWRYPGLEAEDLVQGFFAAVLEQGIIKKFDPAKGRFRPYLITCLDQFIAKQRTHASREKRGGHLECVELDEAGISGGENPEERFEREWERGVFEWAIAELRQSHAESLRWRLFESHDLTDAERPSYAELAERHGLTVATVTNHLAALQYQIQPHFLFNAMNMLAALVLDEDRERPHRAILNLSDFLRVTLRPQLKGEVALREELELTRKYLSLD